MLIYLSLNLPFYVIITQIKTLSLPQRQVSEWKWESGRIKKGNKEKEKKEEEGGSNDGRRKRQQQQ